MIYLPKIVQGTSASPPLIWLNSLQKEVLPFNIILLEILRMIGSRHDIWFDVQFFSVYPDAKGSI